MEDRQLVPLFERIDVRVQLASSTQLGHLMDEELEIIRLLQIQSETSVFVAGLEPPVESESFWRNLEVLRHSVVHSRCAALLDAHTMECSHIDRVIGTREIGLHEHGDKS